MTDYPLSLELDAPLEIARWRPLVHWLLAVPHLAVASVLDDVGGVLSVVSWFAILFTGRLPAGIANFQCLILRYSARACSHALFLREQYPAFEFTMAPDDPGGDPLRVDVRPQLDDRDKLTVGLRFLWALPIAVFAAVVDVLAVFAALAAAVVVATTGRWLEGLHRFIVGTGRLNMRASAYMYLLVDEYPPFALA